MSGRTKDCDEAELARQMLAAVCKLALGHPQSRVALAVTKVCGALVQTCAKPGLAADAIRASAEYMEDRADRIDDEATP